MGFYLWVGWESFVATTGAFFNPGVGGEIAISFGASFLTAVCVGVAFAAKAANGVSTT